MDSNRTSDLSKLSRLSRSPLTSSTGAPDLSKLSILSRNSNASDADKLARLGERSSNFSRHQPHLKDSSSPPPFSQHADATRMYVHYTLSEDRSGSADEVIAQRLKALNRREKQIQENPWLQCLWAGCRDSWHRDHSSLSLHVDRHVKSARYPFCCQWQGCRQKGLPLSDSFLLMDHVISHTGQRYQQSFDHVEDLDSHVRLLHSDRRYIIDDDINARFSTRKLRLAEDGPKEDALNLHVLIISDNLVDQDVLDYMLNQREDNDVKIAKDRQDAHDKIHFEKTSRGRGPFDIVFVNMMMPIMDNVKVTPNLRTLTWGIPIIGLTRFSYSEDDCREAGISGFLTRPFNGDALRNVIRRHCPRAYPKVTQGSAAGF